MALTKVSTGMIEAGASSVDLNIDEGTLFIDASNNRVGVANVSPATALDVSGTITGTLFSGSGASLTNIPNVALDNSSITINSYSTALGGTVTLSTSDIGEGTNLYYTDARARSSISITDSGGDGSLAYDNGTGVITYTGPSAAEVRAHISAGTGVDFSSGVISIGQSVGTSDTVTFNNLTVSTTATIPYDNTISGLTATNIQSAITELNTLVGGGNIGSQANYEIYEFTATGNQTTFDISTQGSPAPSYDPGYIQVFMNGVLLSETDYTAVDGSNVVLSTGATAGQLISIITLDSFNIQELLRVTSIDASASTDSIAIDANDKVTLSSLAVDTDTLIVDATNNRVGIGTTSPSYKLALKDNSASAYPLSLESGTIGTAGNHTGIRFGFTGNTYQKGAIIFEGQDANGRGKMYFAMEGTANSSNADETDAKMTIDYSGNVGIGTDDPAFPLHINSSSPDVAKFQTSGSYSFTRFQSSNGTWALSIGDDFSIYDEDAAATRMVIDSTTGDVEVVNDLLTNNAKLKAIAESNTDTAVDVFVYDTRKDSDGGAWRKRTQNTSWYNETLNTSTRGSRKEFPCVAVIVAEATQLTIYDGDDPSLPMWMIFNSSGANGVAMLGRSSESTTSVAMLNGILSVGRTSFGLHIVHFISDFAEFKEAGYDTPYALPIGTNRNSGNTWTTVNRGNDLVNDTINDVAMTVLPNAPIDADTGLPVPTIAAATDGGVSVIKGDGTIVNITVNNVNYTYARRVNFLSDNSLGMGIGVENGVAQESYYIFNSIPSSDNVITVDGITGTTKDVDEFYSIQSPNAFVDLQLLGLNSNRALLSSTGNSFASNEGLSIVDRNVVAPDKGLISYIASTYNTGWMNGDIKLATLSDTDDTDVTGSELVTNGDFSSSTGWTIQSGWSIDTGAGTASCNGTNGTYLYQTSGFPTNTKITISFYITSYTSGSVRAGSTGVGPSSTFSGVGSHSITYTTASNDPQGVEMYSINFVGTIDNVSARIIEEDRSINDNGLQVFGTVTKTAVATGAELVGYTPSSSSYLRQPSAGGLTLTSDFSITWWQKYNGGGSVYEGWQIVEDDISTATAYSKVVLSALHEVSSSQYLIRGANVTASSVTNGIASGAWTCMTITKTGGNINLYTNGKLSSTTAGTCATPSSPYSLEILRWSYETSYFYANNSTMALFRTSNTIPTEEQIKKMYEDEKHLFVENAKATLYGSSNAVTALAYDDDTELLHVGTSAGRSEFQGLRRVNNTTDAISEAISASNGFIVED